MAQPKRTREFKLHRREKKRVTGPYAHGRRWRVRISNAYGAVYESFETKAAAETFKRRALRKVNKRCPTVDESLTEYIWYMKEREYSASYLRSIRYRCYGVLEGHLDKHLDEITPELCQRLYDRYRNKVTHLGKRMSNDTQLNAMVYCKTWMKWCVKRGWIKRNPFESVETVGRKKKGKAVPRIDEARKLAKVCMADGSRGALGTMIALTMGLRASEVLGISPRDVDDNGRIIWIERQHTKTDRGVRQVAVPPELVEWIERLMTNEGLFPGRKRYWLRDQALRMCKKAGIAPYPPQSLRAAAGTYAVQYGNLRSAQALLGHTSSETTRSHYVDPSAMHNRTTQDGWNVILGGQSPVENGTDI